MTWTDAEAVDAEEEAGVGRGGWKDCGGYREQNVRTDSQYRQIPTSRSNIIDPESPDTGVKESHSQLTTSKPLPLNILSVVATTFPPFLCKSHMIFRRDTCGNICCTRSTSASLARILFADVTPRFCDEFVELEKKKYRIARPPRTMIRSSCGTFTVWSAILCAEVRAW